MRRVYVFIDNKKKGVEMKSVKGEAAFDSNDDVLAKRINNSTEKTGNDEGPSTFNSTCDCSYDDEECGRKKTGWFQGKAVIIAACIGIVLLIAGILMFRCKKCCGRK